jgi:hypothetical protein
MKNFFVSHGSLFTTYVVAVKSQSDSQGTTLLPLFGEFDHSLRLEKIGML